MASLGELLSGALGGEYSMGRPLDEEERRLIEELRAQDAYVPQERKVSPFRYGAGTVSQRNLADVRGAIQPEQKRKMNELLWQRSEAARNAAAVEKFNREQGFANQLIEKNKARQIADEQARQHLGGLPTKSAEERWNAMQRSPIQSSGGMIPREDYIAGATPQITDPQKAELAVLQRNITPALTQLEALKQAQQKTAVGGFDVATKERADDLAKQVHKLLPSNYAQMITDEQVLGLDLKNLLSRQRLAVATQYGKDLLESEADANLAAKRQEIMAIESLETWLDTPAGQNYINAGGPQRFEMRLKLGQLKAALMQAEAAKTKAEADPFDLNNLFRGSKRNNPNTGSGTTGIIIPGGQTVQTPSRPTPP